VVAGATANSQYSTTAPATTWPQVPWKENSYLHIVGGRFGKEWGQSSGSRRGEAQGSSDMHVTEHSAGHITTE